MRSQAIPNGRFSMKKLFEFLWRRKFLLFLLLGGFLLFLANGIVSRIDYRNNDFFTFWLAGHMVWTGQAQYQANEWISGHNQFGVTWIPNNQFVYPLPLALIYAPLGLLDLRNAFILWDSLSEAMILFSVFGLISFQAEPIKKHYLILIFAGAILFRPTLVTLFYGQISSLLLFILTGVLLLWRKEKWLLGGMVLPLVALKPNLGIPILILISFWLLIQKRFLSLAGMAISAVVLVLIGMLLDKNWIIEYLAIGNTKMSQTFGFSPTIWGLSAYLSDFKLTGTIILGGIVTAALLIGVFYFLGQKRRPIDSPLWAMSIAIATTLLITPYTWPYDQLLLFIPIISIVMELMARKFPNLLASITFLFLDVIVFIFLKVSADLQLEILNAVIPLIVLTATLFFVAPIRAKKLSLPNST